MAIVTLETGEELEFDNSYSDEQISQAVDEYLGGQSAPIQSNTQQQRQPIQPRQGDSFFEENISRPALRAGKSIAAAGAGLADFASMATELPLYAGNRAFEYGREALGGQEAQPYQPSFMQNNFSEATRQGFDRATGGLTANRNLGEELLEIPQEIGGGFVSPSSALRGGQSLAQGAKELGKSALQKASGIKSNLVRAFDDAGVTPRLADVTTSKPAKAFQNLLEVYPGSASTIRKATEQQITDIEGQLAGLTKSRGGTVQETGKKIQQGASAFKADVENRVSKLYNDLDKFIPKEDVTYSKIPDELQSFAVAIKDAKTPRDAMSIIQDIKGVPISTANKFRELYPEDSIIKAVGRFMDDTKIIQTSESSKIPTNNLKALTKDAAIEDVAVVGSGDTGKVLERYSQIVDQGGNVSYPRLKIFRSTVGSKLKSPTLAGDERGALKRIYGALSDDMKEAVVKNGGEKGLQAFNKANNAFKRSQDFLDANINPLIDAKTPESVYDLALRGSKKGGSRIKPIMRALNPTQRDFVRGTVAKRMGLQNNSLQNETGEVFSPNKFLTEWNKLSDEASRNIFTPDQVKSINTLNKAITNIKETSQIANRSNNVPWASWAGLIGLTIASPLGIGQAAATVGSAKITANMFTNPDFIRWMAKKPKLPKDISKHISKLSTIAAANALIKEDILDYLDSITNEKEK